MRVSLFFRCFYTISKKINTEATSKTETVFRGLQPKPKNKNQRTSAAKIINIIDYRLMIWV